MGLGAPHGKLGWHVTPAGCAAWSGGGGGGPFATRGAGGSVHWPQLCDLHAAQLQNTRANGGKKVNTSVAVLGHTV